MSSRRSSNACESTSHLQKNSAKRSLFASKTDCDVSNVSNDDIKCKKKKLDVYSQEDINHAVQVMSNGYMTRNRLKKEHTKNNENQLGVKERKSSKNKKPTNNFGKVKKNRKPAKASLKNKLQLGYVFTRDIFLQNPDDHQTTQYKKNTPLLFESESESEIDYFQINNNTDEVESKSTIILNSELISPRFHKNSGVKTYFNKKTCSSNNKLSTSSPKMVETSFKSENSSNLSNHIKNYNGKINDLSEVSNFNTMNSIKKDSSDEENLIVTEDFIRHLEQELHSEHINCTQDVSGTQKISYATNVIESYVSNMKRITENELKTYKSESSSSDFMTNQNNICMIDNIVDDERSLISTLSSSSLEKNIDLNELVDSKPLSFANTRFTENNFSSIFDVPISNNTPIKKEGNLNHNCFNNDYISYPASITPKENVETFNLPTNEFENGTSDQLVDNILIHEKKNCLIAKINECQTLELTNVVIHKHFHSINKNDGNRKSEALISETENDNLSLMINNSSTNSEGNNENVSNIDLNELVDSKPSSFANTRFTENNFSSIFDVPISNNIPIKKEANLNLNCINDDNISYPASKTPKKNTVVYNLPTNDFENGASDQSVNLLMPEKNSCLISKINECQTSELPNFVTHKYVCSINKNYGKRKSETLISEAENYNSSAKMNNSSKKSKNEQLDSKCHCKIFYSFNKNANKILTPKTNHFVFNTYAEKCRQKVLHQKYLEANILEMLINKDNKNYIKSEKLTPTSNSDLINVNYEKKVHDNDHIEPNILNMLKDVYVDFEYVSEYCEYNKNDMPPELQIIEKTPKNKSIDSLFLSKNINEIKTTNEPSVTVIPYEKNYVDSSEQRNCMISCITETNESTYFKPYVEESVSFSKIKNSNNDNLSNITTVNIPPVHILSYEENKMDSGIQKKSNTDYVSNITTVNISPVHILSYEKNNKDSDIQKKNETYNIKIEDTHFNPEIEDTNCNPEIEIKPFNISSSINDPILMNGYHEECEDSKYFQNRSIKNNTELIQTKINDGVKEEKKSVPSSIQNNIRENVFKLPEPPVYKNFFDTNYSKCMAHSIKHQNIHTFPELQHKSDNKSEQLNKNLFDPTNDDIEDSLGYSSSDDDTRLKIEDDEDNVDCKVLKNPTLDCFIDNLKDLIVNDDSASDKNIKFNEMKLIDSKKEPSTKIKIANYDKGLKPIVLNEEIDLSNNEWESFHKSKEENNYLANCMVMTIEMCHDYYRKKPLNNSTTFTNTFFSKKIKDILKEMYVDDIFVSLCQHMVEKSEDETFFQTVSKYIKKPIKKEVCDITVENDDTNIYSAFTKLIPPTNAEIILTPEKDNSYLENNEPSVSFTKTKNSNSPQKAKKVKSNMKIRTIFRNLINSDKMLNEILESKEFRSLRSFNEEEIACSIGVFIFEQTFDPPIITGLSAYKENYDQLSDEEKNNVLGSVNLSIMCPKIMKLTTITLAIVKMLRSNKLIDLILNVIRKNVLNRKMNNNHIITIDQQLITQTVYYVDICVRLRLLKTLQTFIFDSMVLLPNKYCCIIFTSLLLWKNCLPRHVNNEIDPVIITVMSYLIAKKKFFSEQIVGRDIFQRELINLLSFHFNYSFGIDMPNNFTQHVHKPDFFISVVIFLKCCNPKDSVEFMVNCLFPIVEDYLNSQQNETIALKVMESIYLGIRPFKIACNSTVAVYLNKCKGTINGSKKDEKEHIYNITYNSYKTMQHKFVEYLNDTRPRSQLFEESLVSMIMVLGSVDYVTSCVSLMKWNPKFQLSTIICKKMNMFKSIIGKFLWDKLCVIDETDVIKCLVNSCILKKDVYNTIIRLYSLR